MSMPRNLSRTSFRRAALGLSGLAFGVMACSQPDAPVTALEDPVQELSLFQDRFRIFDSQLDHGSTLSALLEALDRRDFTVFAVIDHAAGATSVGTELEPTTLVLFGNPRGGTPLIQAEPLMGAELPLKALIYERGQQVHLAVTGMGFLERQYGLADRANIIDRIADTLDAIATEATTF